MKILVTGAAGFIGFHAVLALLARGDEVVGIDNINDYYDVSLKKARLKKCGIDPEGADSGNFIRSSFFDKYVFSRLDLRDSDGMKSLFQRESFSAVVHLGAQAGVRYSIENPHAYVDSNITGTLNILEGCRLSGIGHLVFASSSSVYGLNAALPSSSKGGAAHPVSLYAATKRSGELMIHSYSKLYGVPATALRFFTIYGPWGRPDMAPSIFTKAILEELPVNLFNKGNMKRSFTYIDDIITVLLRMIDTPAVPDAMWNPHNPSPDSSEAPFRIYNVGNSSPVSILDFVQTIEAATGKKASLHFLPMQKGDVEATWADVSDLEKQFGYKPETSIGEGMAKFVDWYQSYYKISCSGIHAE